MRKLWFLVLCLAIIAAFLFLRQDTVSTDSQITPEILNIKASQATVAWLSKNNSIGKVTYWSFSNEQTPMSAVEKLGPSTQHEVVLTGLQPSTRYTYQIDGGASRFQFQTQPLASSPFSFLIVWGDMSEKIVSLVRSEFADFIVSLWGPSREEKDSFAALRPYTSVYNIKGANSPFLDLDNKNESEFTPWSLDWAGLTLIFTDSLNAISADLLDSPAAHTFGVIVGKTDAGKLDFENICGSGLHLQVKMHNARYPANQVSFAVFAGSELDELEIDGIKYFGIAANTNDSGAVRIDIDVDSAKAVFLANLKEVDFKKPPLNKKLTCEDCRRLADRGAYESSVQAYKSFIETNQGHFQIDDAYFAIADIYDFKLFEYANAIFWYEELIKRYPNGTLVPLAKQRLKHLNSYSDYNFEPLYRFERIRTIEYARKKGQNSEREKLLTDVERIIEAYPDSRVAPVMQLWLANQYRAFDTQKAVEAYTVLKEKYQNSNEAKDVTFEIGATYYDAGQYRNAIEVFKQALIELPSLKDTINAQIARSQRNIRRDQIALLCCFLMIAIGAWAFLTKPKGINVRVAARALTVFLVMVLLLYAGAWLIREQFNSSAEMHSIILSFAVSAALSVFVAAKLSKVSASSKIKKNRFTLPLAGTSAALIFFIAGIYLSLYCVYVHYLIIVKL